jgi:8-oxo-dGTP diphosphatase
MTLVLVAAAALIDGSRVLVTRRPEGKPMAGLWEFPGGKVEAGETPERALVRELHEEIAVDVDPSDLVPLTFASHGYARFHLLMPLFACRAWRGEPVAREVAALRFVTAAELARLPMPDADAPLVRHLAAELGH